MSAIAQRRIPVGYRVVCVVAASAQKDRIVDERRVSPRVRRFLEAQLIDPAGLQATARVTDISCGGCYVSTVVTPHRGAHCQLFLSLPKEGVTALDAEVVRVYPQVGCGVRFVEPSRHAEAALARTVSTFLAEQ